MNERQIWRPNSIAIEDWEKLTRDEQIRCWKDNQPKRPPFDIFKFLKNSTDLNSNDIVIVIFENMTEQNFREVLDACSSQILESLMEYSNKLPVDSDSEAWSRGLYVKCVSYAPWMSADEICIQVEDERKRFREGVRLFRAQATK